MRIINALAFAVGCVYATIPCFWLLVHPFAERWRKRNGARYQILVPAWMGMWIAAGAATWRWRRVFLYKSFLGWIAGVPLIGAGLFLYLAASRGFTPAQLGGRPEVEPAGHEQRLVTAGIRQRVRHPIYLGHLCEILGWTVGTGMLALVALTGFAVATGAVMVRMEEAELERRFGDPYRRYREQVPALIPSLRPRALDR